ncbi:hypothetical protein [Streptomyces sp. NPDC006285]|uniref:hypothetical protein n=1 Tax=Streptomyces sp. NPDC006285 TaxID=3364742 RepID=UPI00368D5AB7
MRDPSSYEIDPVRGFLPARDPLERLPHRYEPWEQLTAKLPQLMGAGRARDVVSRLQPLDAPPPDADRRELWRAYMLLSLLANAYVMDGPHRPRVLPRAIAVPLCQVSGTLGMPPIPTYATLVLHNWSRVDPDGPPTLDNLLPLCPFSGGMDEQWFFLSMAAIEADGAPAVAAVHQLRLGVLNDRPEQVAEALARIARAHHDMIATLRRIPERCDPYVFFNRVRPPMLAWGEPGVVYEGVSATPQSWGAASGAQSALLQALEAALGITHSSAMTGYLRESRAYMPPGHRQFLADLESEPPTRDYVLARGGNSALTGRYNEAVDLLDTFRRRHMEIVVRYVSKQSDPNENTTGTGGTDFIHFLNTTRRESTAHRIH